MSNIIVVFPKRENAVNIRNSLVRAGIEVSAVCLTGAKASRYARYRFARISSGCV